MQRLVLMVKGQSAEDGLENARLGRVAQGCFRTLVDNAGLTITSPTPDLNGTDFLIENLPSIDIARPGLDRRKEHPKCEVQLKATLEKTPKARIKLSSLQTLVTLSRPAVIAILHCEKVDGEIRPKALYLVHLLNERLGNALKALRAGGLSGKHQTNKIEHSITARKEEKVDLTSAALLAAFHRIVGPDMDAYAALKRHQYDSLGYPDVGRVTVKVEVVGTIEDIVDGWLGLQPFKATKAEAWEKRFDLAELRNSGPAKIHMQLPPAASGKLRAYSLDSGDAAEVNAVVTIAPIPLAAANRKMIIRTDVLELVVQTSQWNVKTQEPPPRVSNTSWIDDFRLAEILYAGNCTVEFLAVGKKLLSWTTRDISQDHVASDLRVRRQLLERCLWILEQAGAEDIAPSEEQLLLQYRSIHRFYEFAAFERAIFLRWELFKPMQALEPTEGLFTFAGSIGDMHLVCALNATISGQDVNWQANLDSLITIEPMGPDIAGGYDRFVDRLKRMTPDRPMINMMPTTLDGYALLVAPHEQIDLAESLKFSR